jgi:hypothetical protein
VSNWIFISKGGQDPYINDFARGCNTVPVNSDNFDYDSSDDPMVLRGILKKKWIHRCWEDSRDFYFMDTGYFGNERTQSNPNGWKYWHRIVKNDLQHDEIIDRPGDRFATFKRKFVPWRTSGRKILIAAPDEKPMKFYEKDLESWLTETVNTIKQYTDRPVEIRRRNKLRLDRMTSDTLADALNNDVFALVTFQSNAAVESVFQGIPVFVLAPTCAAAPVGLKDLSKIETPYYPDRDKLQAWGNHLAYGQFHISEIKNGKAKELLEGK